ncbi:MAG: SpaH/EbpB family LPXTG-anchored major pilin [Actinobacteria bacterium]|nr:SpaH/EbpB family LPXTG-anchored major pilin [Actinomycetota bacterium]
MIAAIASRTRRSVALGVTLILALAFTPLNVSAASALSPIRPAEQPTGPFTIEIHKFEQPDALGQTANGLPQDTTGLTPVRDADFTAIRVPGIDLTTNAGQAAAAALDLDAAAALVAGEPIAASDTTDANGNATLGPLAQPGLYYVQETVTPVGYVGAAPFLVALPLTDPVALNSWLSVVHVYPKNAPVGITLDVIDQAAVKLGDIVHWLSKSDIPTTPQIDGYRVVQRVDPKLRIVDGDDHITVGFDVSGAPLLVLGTHYTRTVDRVTGQITIDVLQAGLDELENVIKLHPGAKVTVGYQTNVLDEGALINEALLYASRATIDGDPGAPPPVSDTNVTKWGPIAVRVHERGNPSNLIQGATVKLYLSEQDARDGTNPIEVSGVSEWTTDVNGMLHIPGLRFSTFANGLDRDRSDPLFRYYWVMPTYYPTGWTGEKYPLPTTVFSTTDFDLLQFVVWRERGGLPDTGAQIGGAAILGTLLIVGGLVFLRRRRKETETETSEQ